MIKKIVISLGVLVVLVVVGLYALTSNLDSIVKAAVEEGGSRVTQVQVQLDRASIDITNARGGLFGLTVANPPGFKTQRALKFGAIGLELGSGSTTSLLIIDKVVIDNPEITYEIGAKSTNVDVLKKNIDGFIASTPKAAQSGGSSSSGTGASGQDSAAPKLIIRDLYINGGKVNVSASLMLGKTLTAKLDDIHLKDIGKKSGGATAGEVAVQIVNAISKNANEAAGALDLGQIGISNLDAIIGGGSGGAVSTLKSVGSGAKAVIEKGAGAIGGAIKGLLGN